MPVDAAQGFFRRKGYGRKFCGKNFQAAKSGSSADLRRFAGYLAVQNSPLAAFPFFPPGYGMGHD